MLINKAFISNVSFGWIKTIFVVIYQFLLVFFVLKFSTHQVYGEFVIANQLGNYLLLFTSSINLGMVKVLIDYKKSSNYFNYLKYLIKLFGKISILIMFLTFLIVFFLKKFTNFEYTNLILLAGLNTSILVMTLFYEAIHKANEHHKKYYIRFCYSLIIRLIFILTLFKNHNTSESLLFIMFVSNTLYLFFLSVGIPTKKIISNLFKSSNNTKFRSSIFSQSRHSLLRIIVDQSTRFLYLILPSFFFGTEASSYIEISSKIGQAVYSIFSSVNSVFLSRYNSFLNLFPNKDILTFNDLFILRILKNSSYVVYVCLLFVLPYIYMIWLGDIEIEILNLSYLFLIYFIFKSGSDIQIPIIVSQDKIKKLSYSFIICLVIQIVISLISIKFLEKNYSTYFIIIGLSVGIIFRNLIAFPKISNIKVMKNVEIIVVVMFFGYYCYSIIINNLIFIYVLSFLLLIYSLYHLIKEYGKYKDFTLGSK